MQRTSKAEKFHMSRGITMWCRVMIVVVLIFWAPSDMSGHSGPYEDVLLIAQREAENSDKALGNKKKVDLQVFTSEDSGKEYKLSVGEEFQVRLWENPTTGYLWTILGTVSSHLELVDRKFTPGKDTRRVGTGGERVFVFRAIKPGRAVIHMTLKRPWENEGTEAESYFIKLTIE
jgi:inhibitor of cysteine peptidase